MIGAAVFAGSLFGTDDVALTEAGVSERTTDVKTLDDGLFQTNLTFGDGETIADVDTWTITTAGGEIVLIEEFWDRLSSFSTDRPESPAGGTLFDVMTAQTIDTQTAVCTWQTLLLTMTEAEFLAAGNTVIEESVVAAALDCELDPEAIPGLRLALQRSALMTE